MHTQVANQVSVNHKPRIIAVTNQKGGVGKTTTAINLATALASTLKKVLIIDLDPQGNASTGLGIPMRKRKFSTYDIMINNANPKQAILNTAIMGLDIIPSSADLSGAEIELIHMEDREFSLERAIIPLYGDYDYILLDCPPALNLLTINALVASQSLIIPLQCEFFALEGISFLIRSIDRIKKSLNPSLEINGIILTMYDKRNNLSKHVANDVRNVFGNKVFNTMIPRNVRISEAPSYGKPILIYDHRSAGANAYIKLASEFIKREENAAHD